MDKERQIRFLIPPFFMAASMLWGYYLCNGTLPAIPSKYQSTAGVISGIALSVAIIIPIGYLIGTLTITVLRISFWLCRGRSFEASVSKDSLVYIWPKLATSLAIDEALMLYAVTTFDHEIVSEAVHKWLIRRWNGFHTAASSCIALLIAHLAGIPFRICQSTGWWLTALSLLLLLGYVATIAWWETMKMIEFQSHRRIDNRKHQGGDQGEKKRIRRVWCLRKYLTT
jgi:hypothetical protein